MAYLAKDHGFFNKLDILVYRQDGIEPGPFVLIHAVVRKSIVHEKDLLDEIRKSILEWVKNTSDGQSIYGYAADDMNIGDIAGHEDDIIAYSDKICNLKFEMLDVGQLWNFDTSLCPNDPFDEEV